MTLQTFNLRREGFFLGTIQLWSKTSQYQTAKRLRRVLDKRIAQDASVTVHPVLNK